MRKLAAAVLAGVLFIGVSLLLTRPAAAIELPSSTIRSNLMAAAPPPDPADPAEPGKPGCGQAFLGLRPWYYYMGGSINKDNCEIECFQIFSLDNDGKPPDDPPNDCHYWHSDVPRVLLAVIDDLLRIAGLVAVGFVFAGAFKYVESRGNPEKTSQAQSTIINALAGLGVALTAVAFIAFLGSRLGG